MKKFFVVGAILVGMVLPVVAQKLETNVATVRLTKVEQISADRLEKSIASVEQALGRAGTLPAGTRLNLAQRREVLDNLINEILFAQAAARDKIDATEADFTKLFQSQMVQFQVPSMDEFRAAIKRQFNMSLDDYKKKMTSRIILEKYIRTKRPKIAETPAVGEAEIQALYSKNLGSFALPQIVKYYEIFTETRGMPATEIAALKKRFERLAATIKSGGRPAFDNAVARMDLEMDYSARLSGLADNEGSSATYGKAFVDAVLAVKKDTVGGVLESKRGFHIIYVISNEAKRILELDDIIPDQKITAREQVRRAIATQKQMAAVETYIKEITEELRKEADIKVNEKYWQAAQ